MIQLATEFRELFAALNRHRVDYLVIGGYAVGFHGFPRATGDIDVWIAPTRENAIKLQAALTDFGLSGDEIDPEEFAHKRVLARVGVPPLQVDLLNFAKGLEFSQAFTRRMDVDLDGLTVAIIGREDLLTNKTATGRPVDLGDAARLRETAE
jgi:predicted nucleotidyltransferase